MTANAARTPLTTTTWADVAQIDRDSHLGWEVQSDLAHELASASHLTVEQALVLVSAAGNSLPVIITFERALPGLQRIETTTAAVIVESVLAPSTNRYDQVRVLYWGLGAALRLDMIVGASVFQTERTYREIESD